MTASLADEVQYLEKSNEQVCKAKINRASRGLHEKGWKLCGKLDSLRKGKSQTENREEKPPLALHSP